MQYLIDENKDLVIFEQSIPDSQKGSRFESVKDLLQEYSNKKEELVKLLNTLDSSDVQLLTQDLALHGHEVEEEDSLCAECDCPTEQRSAGDEGWTYCENCQSVEGKTYQADIIRSLNLAYRWSKTNSGWFLIEDGFGMC